MHNSLSFVRKIIRLHSFFESYLLVHTPVQQEMILNIWYMTHEDSPLSVLSIVWARMIQFTRNWINHISIGIFRYASRRIYVAYCVLFNVSWLINMVSRIAQTMCLASQSVVYCNILRAYSFYICVKLSFI